MIIFNILVLLALVLPIVISVSNRDALNKLKSVEINSKKAKAVLVRRKRFWWLWEEEEEEEDATTERQRESSERTREQRLERECPNKCWNPWPNTWTACSHQCGGAGIRWQTRPVKTVAQLGECKDFVNKCPGSSRRSQACNRGCSNGGTPNSSGCACSTGWRGTCCQTRVTCSSCSSLSNGRAHPSGCNLPYGTRVQFSCNTGFQLNGYASRVCTASGIWSLSAPTCRPITCSSLRAPANGQLAVISGSGTSYRSSVKVTCNHGYSMQGDSIRTCHSSSQWSGVAPTCYAIICPTQAPPTNGKLTYIGIRVDGEIVHQCNAGYVLQGYNRQRCQTNGQWTGATPICNAITCRNLPAPSNGQVTHDRSSGGKTPYGEKARFSCNKGYVRSGPEYLICGGTNINGRFNGQPPTCNVIQCPDPGNPDYGIRRGSSFIFGGTLTFTCGPGYYLQGEVSLTCLDTGRWSHPKPECKACQVNTYKSETNSDKTCTQCPRYSSTGSLPAASTVTECRCRRGYIGNYGGPCTLFQCPILQTPVNGYISSCGNKLEEKCIFGCDAGHVVSKGDTERICTELGSWTGNDVNCDACPRNSYKYSTSVCIQCPSNSLTTGTGNEKDGCLCQNGYLGPPGGPCTDINECLALNGGCQQTCVNNQGSFTCTCTDPGYEQDKDDFKKCVSRNNCTDLPPPENSGTVCYIQRRTNTKRCQIKCNDGFEFLARPNPYEECGPSTNWKWSYKLKGNSTSFCLPLFFEGILSWMQVFYFTENCSSLGSKEKADISAEFIEFLDKKGVCQDSYQKACSIDDVLISCHGDSNTRKRRNAEPDLNIRFTIRSTDKQLPTTHECNKACQMELLENFKETVVSQSQLVFDIYNKTDPIKRNVTLGGIPMTQTSQVKISPPEKSCGKGKLERNGTCILVPVQCGNPRPPRFSSVTVSGHMYGSIATFQCYRPYSLVGDTFTTCTANGTWAPHTTTCRLFTAPIHLVHTTALPICSTLPPLENGYYSISGYRYGDLATFSCLPNYKLSGDRRAYCRLGGIWSPYRTMCIHYKDLLYNCTSKNPCSPRRLPGRIYYRHEDSDKFIHCTEGACFVRSCPGNTQWNNDATECT